MVRAGENESCPSPGVEAAKKKKKGEFHLPRPLLFCQGPERIRWCPLTFRRPVHFTESMDSNADVT
jgi:hypothetical protein